MTDGYLTEMAATCDRVADELQDGVGRLMRRLRQTRPLVDLAPPESTALASLVRHAPSTAAELARQEGISPQSMGATLAQLERRGLVERSADPADGRRVVLRLTPAGRAKAGEKRSARTDQMATALRREFTATERETLLAAAPLLARLAQSL